MHPVCGCVWLRVEWKEVAERWTRRLSTPLSRSAQREGRRVCENVLASCLGVPRAIAHHFLLLLLSLRPAGKGTKREVQAHTGGKQDSPVCVLDPAKQETRRNVRRALLDEEALVTPFSSIHPHPTHTTTTNTVRITGPETWRSMPRSRGGNLPCSFRLPRLLLLLLLLLLLSCCCSSLFSSSSASASSTTTATMLASRCKCLCCLLCCGCCFVLLPIFAVHSLSTHALNPPFPPPPTQ